MLDITDLDQDQVDAADRLFAEDETLLIAPTGGGKTIITLTAIEELLYAYHLKRVLVIAPLKVANNVWRGEHKLWKHTEHLNVGVATGDDFEDVITEAERYDIVVVNFDMVPKLAESGELVHFDGFVVDEGSKMARGGVWFKKIRRFVKTFKWRVVMSATPITEGWERLFYQTFLCDAGRTFGRNKQKWLDLHFYPTDFQRRKWAVIPTMDAKLAEAVSDMVYVLPDYKHRLPPFSMQVVDTPLPPIGKRAYNEMAGGFETQGVLAKTAAARVGKLQQVCSGFIYNDNKQAIQIHDAKYQVLETVFEKIRKTVVENIIVVYQYVEELAQLRLRYPDLATLDDGPDVVADWNAGKLPLLAMHCLSGSHGLNMAQGGCNVVWLAPVWSLDSFSQMNERLWRRGQTKPVTAWVLVVPDSVDELVLLRHSDKAKFMPAFVDHLKAIQDAA